MLYFLRKYAGFVSQNFDLNAVLSIWKEESWNFQIKISRFKLHKIILTSFFVMPIRADIPLLILNGDCISADKGWSKSLIV